MNTQTGRDQSPTVMKKTWSYKNQNDHFLFKENVVNTEGDT